MFWKKQKDIVEKREVKYKLVIVFKHHSHADSGELSEKPTKEMDKLRMAIIEGWDLVLVADMLVIPSDIKMAYIEQV